MIAQLLQVLNVNNRNNNSEGTSQQNSLPTAEQLAALQRAMAEGWGGGKGMEGQQQQQGSTYFDLRSKSKTKLVNPVPSKYADVKKKDENKK